MELIQFTDKGLFCPVGDFYIDPWKGVKKAIITHGHSDHARRGSKQYICQHQSKFILQHRLGSISVASYDYGEQFSINGVGITFIPAGHIIGSSQIKLTYRGKTWVITGDFKIHPDPIATDFEPVPCDVLVTESTFGMPIYQWQDPQSIITGINEWWEQNRRNNVQSIVLAYSLGKAQRIIQSIEQIGKIYTHKSIYDTNEVIRHSGISLRTTDRIYNNQASPIEPGSMIITPPSGLKSSLMKGLGRKMIACASGWMAVRGNQRNRGVDRGFVLSDHADWIGLNQVIMESNPELVYVTHGYTHTFARWLNEIGRNAKIVRTAYRGENENVESDDVKG